MITVTTRTEKLTREESGGREGWGLGVSAVSGVNLVWPDPLFKTII